MENYTEEILNERPSLQITTDYDDLQEYIEVKNLEHQEQLIETENYYAEQQEEYRENMVDSLDDYLYQFTEVFIKRYELDEKLEAILVARALKGFITLKLPDELLSRVKSLREQNDTTLNDQLVQLIEAGMEVPENE